MEAEKSRGEPEPLSVQELVAVVRIRQRADLELAEDAIAAAGDKIVSGVAQESWEDASDRCQRAPAATQFAKDEKSSVRASPQVLPWLIKIRDDVKRVEIGWRLSLSLENASRR